MVKQKRFSKNNGLFVIGKKASIIITNLAKDKTPLRFKYRIDDSVFDN